MLDAFSSHPAYGNFGDSAAVSFRGLQVTNRRSLSRFQAEARCHWPDRRRTTIPSVRSRPLNSLQVLWLIGGWEHSQTDVDHSMLHCIYHQTKEGIHLVTRKVARIGKCAGDLIFPGLSEPFAGAGLHKLLH